MSTKKYLMLTFLLILCVGIVLVLSLKNEGAKNTNDAKPDLTASYYCAKDKTIIAEYYNGKNEPTPKPNKPPSPNGKVSVSLSDGRQFYLAQTISADGIRYSNKDESIIFWSKGNEALFLENNVLTFTGCLRAMDNPGNLPQVYSNGSMQFSLRYPAGFTVDEKYKYENMGPGKEIYGIKFEIPKNMATGTNLSTDSYISIEQIQNIENCSANAFTYDKVKALNITDGETEYSFASTTGAGAGNRYEEKIYAFSGTNPCTAIRYFIHYGAIENYPEGAVVEFNREELLKQFDSIRKTFVKG